jgi:Ca2+/Na+ antiporter
MSLAVQLIKSKKLTSIETTLFWSILYLGTGTILWTSLDYFLPNTMHSFLFERMELTMQDWWRYTLYAHVIGGLTCLIASLLQYSKLLLKRAPRVHKSLGYIYALCIITLIFPTGVALSFVAKGGTTGMIGFLFLAIATLATLILGMVAIFKRNIKSHQAWITRSFALVTTAITFRTLQLCIAQTTITPETNYQLSLWLSIAINLMLAEYYLYKSTNKLTTKLNK